MNEESFANVSLKIVKMKKKREENLSRTVFENEMNRA